MSEQAPIIDAATIADCCAARCEAEGRGDQAALDVASRCEQAAAAANEGHIIAARSSLEGAMAQTDEPRLLFLGFQFFFRTAIAETATLDERAAGLELAEQLVRRRLAVVEARGDRSGIGRALTNLGLVLHYQRRYSEAEEHYRRAVETDRSCADVRGLVRSLGNLGNFYESRFVPASDGDLATAESLYREAIDTAHRAGSPQLAGSPTANLGDLHATRGDRRTARLLWQRAIDLSGEGDIKVRLHCQRRLSETH